MGWPVCNSTDEYEKIDEVAVYHGLTFHQLGLILSAGACVIAILVSFYLMLMHATHYLKPWEQRHIIRILFMVPIYATVSFLSYLYYTHSIYFETLRDCYEAFAIASFFTLLCHYVADDLHQQKNYFRTVKPKKWVWPMGWIQKCWGGEKGIWRTPRSGLTWFNVIWVGVFQYCFVRVFFTCVAVVTQAFNLYCSESVSPAFAHVWVMGFEAVSVTIAMYCIIQFYVQLKDDIAEHKPILKVAAIKLVIFLSFWQSIVISFLTSTGLIKSGPRFGTPDIKIGIPAMLLCVEMAFFAIFHLWAFSWLPYRLNSKVNLAEAVPGHALSSDDYKGGFLGIKAGVDAFNPWDLVKAVGRSARWLFVGRKHRTLDASYNQTRLGTDPAYGLESNCLSTQGDTAYRPPGKQDHMADEGEELLMHSQSNPTSGPPPAYSREHSYDHYPDAADIGVARSVYDDDESSDERGRGHNHFPHSQPPIPTPTMQGLAPPNVQNLHRPPRSPDREAPTLYAETYDRTYQHASQEQYVPGMSYMPHHEDTAITAIPGMAVPYPDPSREARSPNRISMPRTPDH